MTVYADIQALINYGIAQQLLMPTDVFYVRHRLMALLNLNSFPEDVADIDAPNLDQLQTTLDRLFANAVQRKLVVSDDGIHHDLFDTALMDCLMPRPSEVQQKFNSLYQVSPRRATDYYYQQSRASNYIRTERIAQNISWKYSSHFGDLDITINLSKPEIDPKAIAQARLMKSENYPACLLCRENEGFSGHMNHPARQNLRLISLNLAQNESWFLQYSPYEYYNEHCIVLKAEHEPMHVSRKTFERLLDFVAYVPHYFVGSNADLPIVGGSILSHEHFQGGAYRFAMQDASVWQNYRWQNQDVQLQLLNWPLSVIRIRSADANALIEIGHCVLQTWRTYSDDSLEIKAFSTVNGVQTPHNTVTLIARRVGHFFEIDVVLRNNRINTEYPHGIFHPHDELHHIKKENIGLIEVMGLAILPPRLWSALQVMTVCLTENKDLPSEYAVHQKWFDSIRQNYRQKTDAMTFLKSEIGRVFERVLLCAGVFKTTEQGRLGFERFMTNLPAIKN